MTAEMEEARTTIRAAIFAETVVRLDQELGRLTEVGTYAAEMGDDAAVQEYRVRVALQKGLLKGMLKLLSTEIPEEDRPDSADGLIVRAYIIHTGKAKPQEG